MVKSESSSSVRQSCRNKLAKTCYCVRNNRNIIFDIIPTYYCSFLEVTLFYFIFYILYLIIVGKHCFVAWILSHTFFSICFKVVMMSFIYLLNTILFTIYLFTIYYLFVYLILRGEYTTRPQRQLILS